MIKILNLFPSKDIQMVLGTSVEIIAMLNKDKPSSITVSIEDPTNVQVVNGVEMSRVNTKIYNYVYQSNSIDQEGQYIITVSVNDGTNTAVRQETFILDEQLT